MINGDVTYSIIEYSNLHSRSPTGVAAIPLKIPPSLGGGLGVGVMAGAQMSQGGMNTTAMIQPQMAQTNMAQTQMMQSKDNIVINATDTFQGNVNLNITPDGSVNIQKTSAPPIAQTTQAPQQANVSKFTPKIPSK
jgi:outer membrane scaffolding protein for murein synthesis (MipA/OmpV family)